MNEVNKTLYIPLYGKAYVSRKGLFLQDKKAEEIWAAEKFPLKGKSKSKWLAYYMGIRSAVFDDWVRERLAKNKDAIVIQVGCGLDGRVLRVHAEDIGWYDVDFPEVIAERVKYYTPKNGYKMLACDVREDGWLNQIEGGSCAVIVMEGVSMYLTTEELQAFIAAVEGRFERCFLLMDCYSNFAAKMSKHRNPVTEVGVLNIHGLDNPTLLESGGMVYLGMRGMTPKKYIDQLRGVERFIFKNLYAGNFSKKLYRMYEYRKE